MKKLAKLSWRLGVVLVVIALPRFTTRFAAIESTQSTDPILSRYPIRASPLRVMDLLRRDAYWVRLSAAQGWPRSIRVTKAMWTERGLEDSGRYHRSSAPKIRAAAWLMGLTEQATLLSVVKPLFVRTADRTVMSHSVEDMLYQATRSQIVCPGPWAGESPESQPRRATVMGEPDPRPRIQPRGR